MLYKFMCGIIFLKGIRLHKRANEDLTRHGIVNFGDLLLEEAVSISDAIITWKQIFKEKYDAFDLKFKHSLTKEEYNSKFTSEISESLWQLLEILKI